jgi:hypothetical protein
MVFHHRWMAWMGAARGVVIGAHAHPAEIVGRGPGLRGTKAAGRTRAANSSPPPARACGCSRDRWTLVGRVKLCRSSQRTGSTDNRAVLRILTHSCSRHISTTDRRAASDRSGSLLFLKGERPWRTHATIGPVARSGTFSQGLSGDDGNAGQRDAARRDSGAAASIVGRSQRWPANGSALALLVARRRDAGRRELGAGEVSGDILLERGELTCRDGVAMLARGAAAGDREQPGEVVGDADERRRVEGVELLIEGAGVAADKAGHSVMTLEAEKPPTRRRRKMRLEQRARRNQMRQS